MKRYQYIFSACQNRSQLLILTWNRPLHQSDQSPEPLY
ncbi:hypothetical protein BGS_0218 [Beggiatoa sp. SS]|nr:hypothetical protein BGS_0218 [Beggiatoa sp. SS]